MLDAIRQYLALISDTSLADDQRLHSLACALDRLAWEYHGLPDSGPADDNREPPARTDLSDAIKRAFPSLGWYPCSDSLKGIEESPLMCDGLDDVADIAATMIEAMWRWENLGEADAAWYLRLVYGHWGRHLHNLRSYLHATLHGW
jgi:hypothetical protein